MEAATLIPSIFSGGPYASAVDFVKLLPQEDGIRKIPLSLSNQDHRFLSETRIESWPDMFLDEGVVPNVVPTYVGHERHSSGSDLSQMDEMYPDTYTTLKSTISTISVDSGSTCTTSSNVASVLYDLDSDETFQDLNTLMEQGSLQETLSSLESSTLPDCSPDSFVSSDSSTSTANGQTNKTRIPQTTFNFDSCVADPSDESSPAKKTKYSVELTGDRGDKYLEQRRKNNIASRYSRLTRKQRQKEMEEKASDLEQENETLRVKIEKLEELIQVLKTVLLNSVLKKK